MASGLQNVRWFLFSGNLYNYKVVNGLSQFCPLMETPTMLQSACAVAWENGGRIEMVRILNWKACDLGASLFKHSFQLLIRLMWISSFFEDCMNWLDLWRVAQYLSWHSDHLSCSLSKYEVYFVVSAYRQYMVSLVIVTVLAVLIKISV